jgi:23S rRNA pseudouridine1911/1915/1917 synthase
LGRQPNLNTQSSNRFIWNQKRIGLTVYSVQIAPKILFEDTHLIVLSKPAGMLSQGDISGDESLVDWLRKYVGRNYVGLVHRLDRNTSGLMIVGKRSKAANRLTESLQKGELARSYIAIVEGKTETQKNLQHYLLKNEEKNEVRVVDKGTVQAKEARLSYNRLASTTVDGTDVSVLHVVLETGRGHQIRAQLSHEGHPLLGDAKYRSTIKKPQRPALHSYSLKVPHPMSEDILDFKDSLPEDLTKLIPKGLEIKWP